ncbi:D-glycero-beta-D-manno-heptose-7-phosphate kinase [Pseudodesulfovibrio thermohalotolerans]|uniref:D-glycero-beta-D-manno-heptose-7-phosphate kinase n=1 Tax=Pseudodesulfovibrio thermohalotolerans TaxID=2880651 RepID=UPI0024412672|nr:D-glycero-beta-D-manno-heptose-7-phosphate kinase [Pseudodesulfovibrio thermohalotolerans]WFS62575.1 D-glycero-beta-D-manno-heptose-7-phosphate kinase [Pseudodesulfovibrio thermohalotolerans]
MSHELILEAVNALKGHKVMIIGDLMLDHYLMGGVERISPEAPVPVVRVEQESYLLGGAGNVARNIADLGGKPLLIGAVGTDGNGSVLENLCNQAGLSTRLIQDGSRPTTVKTRIIAHNQQVVRVDQERVGPLSPAELDTLFVILEENLPDYPVVILSDYGKGFISREFMDRFMPLVKNRATPPMVLVDPKTVNYDLYQGVDLLTPNTKEASEGANLPVSDQESVIDAGRAIFRRLGCRNLLITLGPDGMALFEGEGAVRHIPTFARKVFDVTGAGDTVIATTGLALAAGMDLLTACTLANYAAGVVVAQVGAATATPEDLRETVGELPEPQVTYWQE